jgi:hypothetical protein
VLRRSAFHTFVISAGALFAATGCAVRVRPAAPAAEPEREAPRIDVETAYNEVLAGRAMLIDVRGPIGYQERRAAGAILITVDDIEQKPRESLAQIPANKKPILYCT